jgi:cytochrome c553
MKTLLITASIAAASLLAAPAWAGNVAKGAELAKKGACASCHGEGLNKPIDASYPKIAGQYEDYLYVALKAYKTEGAATHGRNNAVMKGIVAQFSLSELKDLAAYTASLPGDLKVVPQSKFRK